MTGLLAVELTWAPGSPEERLELVSTALAMARRLSDELTFAEVVSNGDEPRSVPERADANVQDTAEACAIAERMGSLGLRIRAHTTAASALLDVGDRDGFDRVLRILDVEAAEIVLPDFDICATFHRINAAALDGDAAAVAAAANRYYDSSVAAGAPANASLVRSSALVLAGAMRGDLDALPDVEQAIAENPLFPPLRALLAWSLSLADRPADAARAMTQDRSNEFVLPYNEGWASQAFWLEAVASIGDVESVAVLLPRLEEWIDLVAFVQGFYGCSIAHYAGVGRLALGDLDLAVGHLEHALNVHDRLRTPFHRSWSQVALSRALVERSLHGDRDRARMLASDSLSVALERGYAYVERDATAVLDQLG